jgi:hypothetical protein
VIEAVAQSLSVQMTKIAFQDTVDLVHSIDAFAVAPNSGLLVLPPPFIVDRYTIFKLAVQHRLPAMYSQRRIGGLISDYVGVEGCASNVPPGAVETYDEPILNGISADHEHNRNGSSCCLRWQS